ncbi:MAG: class II fructose-bisphosphate aldolase, partial [Lachnospiraceae bacterium]|nr:class II fructose-bisphosphate aldolase [Lachnospiraceae bacterium]
DIDRLDAIHAAAPGLALVLHGGSGIPDDQLEVAFSRGINKFNYGTNYLWTYYRAMESFIKEHEKDSYTDVLDMSVPAQKALMEHMKDRFGLCHFA